MFTTFIFSVLSNKDTNQLLHHIMNNAQKKGQWTNAQIYCDTIVASKAMLARLREPFKAKMNEKAAMVVENG